MKVVIPMAGRGTRLRPHTLTLPKPLLRVCGKSIIEWIVEEIKISVSTKIEEIHYVIGDFGTEIEESLLEIAQTIGSKGFIHYQKEALGTAHAIYCAKQALVGEVFIAFADTIFKGKIDIEQNYDGFIWTMKVDNPEKYGVVTTDNEGVIKEFIEKPKSFVSDNAIVGLYYFREANKLCEELEYLINNDLRENNEFQITNCLEELTQKGNRLKCAELEEWLDCGNKEEFLNTNKRLIELTQKDSSFKGRDVVLKDSNLVGYNSIGDNVVVENSEIENSIIYDNVQIKHCKIKNSIVGSNSIITNTKGKIFIGDYTEIYND